MFNLSKEDARELIRVMHEDQGSRQPGFSSEFALQTINTLSNWFEDGKYHNTLWLERWQDAPTVRLEPASPPSSFDDVDDVPF